MIVDWLDIVCRNCGHDCQVAVLDLVSSVAVPRCPACGANLAPSVNSVTAAAPAVEIDSFEETR